MGDIFEAREIGVTTSRGDTLIRDVSFALPERTVLAVIGPSGAGKSTLLRALAGVSPPCVGEVRYADRDLYDDYEKLRHRIAVVPQDDVLHSQLTVADALAYAARLRFPADTTAEDRRRRIDEVLAELDLAEHADQRISELSGGQRKRASVALELLTRPSLLFLDEPTSGLDPGMDRALMKTLRTLADDPDHSRTVVVVTHNVANIDTCDRLLLLTKGGHVAYFGTPAGALEHFGCTDYAEIFLQLDQWPGENWARLFRLTPAHLRHIGPGEPGPSRNRAPRQQSILTQVAVLARRQVAVVVADRQYAAFMVALPLVLSLLSRAVPGNGLSVSAVLATQDPRPITQLLLVLVIGAALMGAAVSVRELVKERAIYLRERAFGLSLVAYVASKVVVLTALTAAQATVFTTLSLIGRQPPDHPLVIPFANLEILAAVLGVAVVSMLVGLALSAVIGTADQGMPLLVLLIMAQMLFSGGLFAIDGRPVLEQLAWLVPARWGFAMAAATTELGSLYPESTDPLWESAADVWVTDAIGLVVITVGVLAVIVLRLRQLDPRRRRQGRSASPPTSGRHRSALQLRPRLALPCTGSRDDASTPTPGRHRSRDQSRRRLRLPCARSRD